MKTSNIPIRVHEKEKQRLESVAKRRGITLADMMRRGVMITSGFDDEFSDKLDNLCQRMNLPESVVIQNIVTRWMAEQDAEMEFNPKKDTLLTEFTFSSIGPLPSGILYKNIKAEHLKNLEANRAAIIRYRKGSGGATQPELDWLDEYDHQQELLKKEQEEATRKMEEGQIGVLSGEEILQMINNIKTRKPE